MLRDGAGRGAQLVVFPELALTTFFPRWDLPDAEHLAFFEREMPGPDTAPLFAEAKRLGVGFHLGYAELTPEGRRFNTAILVERDGRVVAKYRKIHLPGHETPESWRPVPASRAQVLRARARAVPRPPRVRRHRRDRDLQRPPVARDVPRARAAGSRVAPHRVQHADPLRTGSRAGPVGRVPQQPGDGGRRISERHLRRRCRERWGRGGGRCSRREPDHRPVRRDRRPRRRPTGDEVFVAVCDLDLCLAYKRTVFDFARYRRPEMYARITAQRGVVEPGEQQS